MPIIYRKELKMKVNFRLLTICFIMISLLVFLLPTKTEARASRVKSYYKKSSFKYVAPHYRSSKDSVKFNNYSAKGNYNSFTGKKGYKKWW